MNDHDFHEAGPPRPWSQARLTSLRKVAAELYPREADQRRVIRSADLREAAIAFDPSADNSWSEILSYANNQRKADKLLDILVEENTDNDLLRRIKADQPVVPLAAPNIKTDIDWQGPRNTGAILERITGSQSALVPISYLALGLRRARAVVKVQRSDGKSGSGFVAGDNILITNHHVLPDNAQAATAVCQFNYQQSIEGLNEPMMEYKLRPDEFFETSVKDDWTAVRIEGEPKQQWGALELRPAKLAKEDRVNIIQHPGGGPKQLSFFSNVVLFIGKGRVQYLTDTMPGSSGSPVFDRDWNLVAIHHSGGWLIEPGTGSKAVFFRNEGILVDLLIESLAPKGVLG